MPTPTTRYWTATTTLVALAFAAGSALAQDSAAPAADGSAAAAETGYETTGDAAAGEKVFRKCQACHEVGADAENRVGPHLNGSVGRAMASVDGFAYSAALTEKAAEVPVWTPEELAAFLEKPRDYAKGTKMSFAGLRKEDERADVIAYLAQFADDGSTR